MSVKLKRVYEPACRRTAKLSTALYAGVAKTKPGSISGSRGRPSTELRKWFAHDPEKYGVQKVPGR